MKELLGSRETRRALTGQLSRLFHDQSKHVANSHELKAK